MDSFGILHLSRSETIQSVQLGSFRMTLLAPTGSHTWHMALEEVWVFQAS